MDKQLPINPLTYIINRQYDDRVSIKNKLFKQRLLRAKNLYRKDLLAHYGCVNAIEFSEEGELLVSGGDDRRILLWSVPEAIHGKGNPVAMQTSHFSNIFCLAFNSNNSRIFSGGNDDQVIVHEIKTGQLVTKISHKKPVYGLSVNPRNDNILATAGDDGRILVYDIREQPNADATCMAKYKMGFHSVMYNPINPDLMVTANSEEGIALWDARKPKESLIHYDKDAGDISGISACFNSSGTNVLALRRRLPPVLYETHSSNAVCQFYHPQYYNSCTMKTCSFAGDHDEYILSGSDDFNLYMWKIPPENNSEWGTPHLVLRGHRSIVNQVRYNKQNNLIASSGVEKMIKLWSTMPIGLWSGSLQKDTVENQRIVYSHDDYIYLVGHSGQRISHDYSDHSMQEDSRMMAFFDSLIQREIEGWESQSEATFTSDSDSDTYEQDRIRLSWQSLLRSRKNAEDSSKKHKPNRIAQLIAQKRHRLAKMAHWKSSTLVQRNSGREKHKKRKNHIKLQKSKASSKYVKTSGSPKKLGGKRLRHLSPSTNTSEKENNHIETNEIERTRHKKYRTRQSAREFDTQNQSIDVPSTSSGITASTTTTQVFRVIEQDSDEDPPVNVACNEASTPDNLINILPTPINGTHDMYVNVLEVSNESNVRNQELAASASTSTRSVVVEQTHLVQYDASSVSDSDCELITPIKQRRSHRADIEVDSGFATGPCSSSSGMIKQPRSHPYDSSDDEYKYETFRKRVKKARVNIRKHIGIDSDSN